jgi:hypothetical protein
VDRRPALAQLDPKLSAEVADAASWPEKMTRL